MLDYHHTGFTSGRVHMLLIRFIFSALLCIFAAAIPAYAHAEETIALNSPVTLSSPATEDAAPQWLPSGRDIRIELIPKPAPMAQELWSRIRNGFAMRELDSKLVARHEKWYVSLSLIHI